MKNRQIKTSLLILLLSIFVYASGYGQKETYSFSDSWGKQGMTLKEAKNSSVEVNFSIQDFALVDKEVEKNILKQIEISGKFLPGEEGAPDLPGYAKYVALPNGATAELEIVNYQKEIIKNVDLAPAIDIPFVIQDEPLKHVKDPAIYSKDEFYPATPFLISEKTVIRGVEVVTLGITPFQYNPVSKELIVYRNIELKVNFNGGNGTYGEERLRSRWFDPILQNMIINNRSLPEVSYNTESASRATGYEYVIVVPDDATFISWADTIKQFRTLQGINTGVVTISDIGSNDVETIKNYFVNAYNNWDVPPAAVLIMADYGTSGVGITSKEYPHPYMETYITDNYYADVVNNDGLPDIAFARMTAQNGTHLETMINKFKDYELDPPTATNFYDNPITACGWQTERWFQLCSEIVGGYLKNVQGKNPVRINAIYSGTPGSDWSTATNTSDVVNYFGPGGLDYIPASPSTLGGWSGGTATDVVNAINNGSFLLQHRDHGFEGGWGEPGFQSANISSLTNTDLSFIFSINCLTGRFDYGSECFAEKFHRYTYNGENAGALGLIAATQVSYSFVNDAFTWGMYDYMWPDFMPDKNATNLNVTPSTLLPGFANVSGKYFLYQSNWPYNTSDKGITYNLFHLHGDAFTMIYSEVPQNLTVAHASELEEGVTSFSVTSNAGSFIALTVNGEIIGTAEGTGAPVSVAIPSQMVGNDMVITITKQNYYRYSATVPVTGDPQPPQPEFTAVPTTLTEGGSVQFTDHTIYSPTSWSWSFEGGTPGASTDQNPAVVYNTAGTYQVALTATNALGSNTETKLAYITVNPPQTPVADFTASSTVVNTGEAVTFNDASSNDPTSWLWTFNGGTPSSNTDQNPVVTYSTPGTYTVTLQASNIAGSDTETKVDYLIVNLPSYCTSQGNNSTYEWIAQVDIGAYTNASGAANYTDFTSEIVNVTSGSIPVTLTPGFSSSVYNEYWKIWIDLNVDGDFDDADELVFDAGSMSTSAVSGNMTIPSSADGVTSRMRVSMKYNGAQTSCESFAYGEVEDYTVKIAGGDTEPPTAPANLAATNVTMTTLNLGWDASTDNVGVTGYDVYQGGVVIGNTINTNYAVSGLNSGTSYSYYVKAKDAAGNESAESNTVNITTFTDTEAPTVPANLTASNIGMYTADLSWDASTDNVGVTGYDVYQDDVVITNTSNTTYQVTGLSLSTSYAFYVKAKDAAGNESAESNTVNVTTLTDIEAPTSPTNLLASNITMTTADLTWDASTDNVGVTGYDVYKDGLFLTSTVSTSYNVTGLLESTTYAFNVKAKDAAGNISPASNTVNVTTNGTSVTYCQSQGNSASNMWITEVQIGSYQNASGATGYTDFTSQTVLVSSGLTPIILTPGSSNRKYTGYWKIWIDLNGDGDFVDTDELVFDAGSLSKKTIRGDMSIPTYAEGITSRMRVSLKYNGTQTSCEIFPYGEVEDYTVQIGSTKNLDMALDVDHSIVDSFSVYPNPAEGYVNIVFKGFDDNTILKIYNVDGRILDQCIMNSDHKMINVNQYHAGVYLIVIENENGIETKRFVKR